MPSAVTAFPEGYVLSGYPVAGAACRVPVHATAWPWGYHFDAAVVPAASGVAVAASSGVAGSGALTPATG